MNKIEKGKKTLKGLSIVSLVLNVLAVVTGIILIVVGANAIGDKNALVGIIEITIGIVFCLASVVALILGVIFGATSSAIKATNGSVVDDNLGHGTSNAVLCSKCGVRVPDDAAFCGNCGEPTKKTVKCACGVENDKDAEFCARCGEKLK